MKKNQLGLIALIAVVVIGYFAYTSFFKSTSTSSYPERPISNVVFSSAGGGTDVWNRFVSQKMEAILGQKINVSNMAEGGGATASAYVWNAAHDGYTWLGCSETITGHPALGAGERQAKDYQFFVMGGSSGIICVPADSPYKTWGDFVKAAQANPGKLKIGNSGLGKLWHLNAYVACDVGKVKVEHVPYKGSAPAIVAALSKEVDAVSASTGEVADFIKSGKLRPIVMETNEDFDYPGYGKVESAAKTFESVKKYYPLNQFLGIAVPKDVPADVIAKVDSAFKKVITSEDAKKFAQEQYAVIYGLSGKEANDMVINMEAKISWMMQDLGLAKVNPEKLGIKRP